MVVTRAIDIWPNFVTRIKDWEGQCQSNRLNNKSYETLFGHYQNHSVPLRMEFFRYIANLLQNVLTKFLAEKPFVAFLSSALEKQMRKLCRIVLKGCIINEATTAYLLTQVDIEKKENQFNFDNVKLGTKQKQMLSWDFALQPETKKKQCVNF